MATVNNNTSSASVEAQTLSAKRAVGTGAALVGVYGLGFQHCLHRETLSNLFNSAVTVFNKKMSNLSNSAVVQAKNKGNALLASGKELASNGFELVKNKGNALLASGKELASNGLELAKNKGNALLASGKELASNGLELAKNNSSTIKTVAAVSAVTAVVAFAALKLAQSRGQVAPTTTQEASTIPEAPAVLNDSPVQASQRSTSTGSLDVANQAAQVAREKALDRKTPARIELGVKVAAEAAEKARKMDLSKKANAEKIKNTESMINELTPRVTAMYSEFVNASKKIGVFGIGTKKMNAAREKWEELRNARISLVQNLETLKRS